MTKICKNCGHRKGRHKFWSVSSEEGSFVICEVQVIQNTFGARDKCGCDNFEEKLKGCCD